MKKLKHTKNQTELFLYVATEWNISDISRGWKFGHLLLILD